jgi:hypothetical protein
MVPARDGFRHDLVCSTKRGILDAYRKTAGAALGRIHRTLRRGASRRGQSGRFPGEARADIDRWRGSAALVPHGRRATDGVESSVTKATDTGIAEHTGRRDGGEQRHACSTRRPATTEPERLEALRLAVRLSLGSAIALASHVFVRALLPAMKADLAWSFAQAGAMNTANAAGYLLGALAFPALSRRWRPSALLGAGCILTAVLMAASGGVSGTNLLLAQRLLTGIGSALIFISGGVLAAASHRPSRATRGWCSASTTAARAGVSSCRQSWFP